MEWDGLTRDLVAPLLSTRDAELQRAALDVIGTRPGWGNEIVGLLAESLAASQPTSAQQALILGAVTAFSANEEVQTLVADSLDRPSTSSGTLSALLEAMMERQVSVDGNREEHWRANLIYSSSVVQHVAHPWYAGEFYARNVPHAIWFWESAYSGGSLRPTEPRRIWNTNLDRACYDASLDRENYR
jgi:hypothetical protein